MLNTVNQGSIGLSAAIYKLTSLGYTVSVPLIDNQCYDLVVDIAGTLNKVEVKSTSVNSNNDNWIVQIKRVRSNKTVNTIYKFDNLSVDYLFIYTMAGDCYFIPARDVDTKNQLTVPGKFLKYKL